DDLAGSLPGRGRRADPGNATGRPARRGAELANLNPKPHTSDVVKMRVPTMAICAMVVGGGACGRIGYDRIGAVRDGGVGGTGGAITGAGGAVPGAGGSAGSAGDGGSFGSGGSGDGGVLVDGGGSC